MDKGNSFNIANFIKEVITIFEEIDDIYLSDCILFNKLVTVNQKKVIKNQIDIKIEQIGKIVNSNNELFSKIYISILKDPLFKYHSEVYSKTIQIQCYIKRFAIHNKKWHHIPINKNWLAFLPFATLVTIYIASVFYYIYPVVNLFLL